MLLNEQRVWWKARRHSKTATELYTGASVGQAASLVRLIPILPGADTDFVAFGVCEDPKGSGVLVG